MTIPCSTRTRITFAYVAGLKLLMLSPSIAMAHWGHLGELAGHGHLVAVGLAGVIGLAIAGLAATKRSETQSDNEDAEAEDAEVTGDKAHA